MNTGNKVRQQESEQKRKRRKNKNGEGKTIEQKIQETKQEELQEMIEEGKYAKDK